MADFDPKQLTDLLKKANVANADDLFDAFKQAGTATKELAKLVEGINELEEAKKSLARTDVKSAIALDKQKQAMLKLAKSQALLVAKEKELTKAFENGESVNQEQVDSFNKLSKSVKEAEHSLGEIKKEQYEYQAAADKLWRSNTLVGKTFSLLESPILKMAGAFTIGSIAAQTWSRWTSAVKLRNELLVKSFQGLDEPMSFGGLANAAAESYKLDKALSGVRSTAVLFGVDVEEATRLMSSYAHIVGTKNPEALEKLSGSTIAIAKTMNLDLAQATEFVSNRIQKFGGTAESALLELADLGKQSRDANSRFTQLARSSGVINKEMEVTIVRADDLASMLTGLSRESSIYALNQRFVTGTLKDTIIKLQAQGESYEFAKEAAKDYMEALTTKAPEWMKILSGENLVKGMNESLAKDSSGKIFMDKWGKDLDKAKPGLSKKVLEVMKNPALDNYAKTRLVQQLTQGTEVGLNSMNDQLLSFYRSSGNNITAIAQQMFGGDFVKAQAAVDAAMQMEKTQKLMVDVNKKSAEEIAATYYGATKDADEATKKRGLEEAKKIKAIGEKYLVTEKEREAMAIAADANRMASLSAGQQAEVKALAESGKRKEANAEQNKELLKEELDMRKQIQMEEEFIRGKEEKKQLALERQSKLKGEIAKIDEEISKTTDAQKKKALESLKEKKEKEISDTLEMDVTAKDTPLDKVRADLEKRQGNTAMLSLDYAKAQVEKLDLVWKAVLGISALLLAPRFAKMFQTAGGKMALNYAQKMAEKVPGGGFLSKMIGKFKGPGGGGGPAGGGGLSEGIDAATGISTGALNADKAAKSGGLFSKLKGMKMGKFGKAAGLAALVGGGAFLASSLFSKSAAASEMPMSEGGMASPPPPPKPEGKGFLSGLSSMVSGEGVATVGSGLKMASSAVGMFAGASKGLGFLGKGLGGIGSVLSMGAALPSAYEAYQSKGLMGAAAELAPSALGAIGGAIGGTLGSVIPVAGTMAGGIGGSMAGNALGEKLAGWMRGTSKDTAAALKPTIAEAPKPVSSPLASMPSGEPSMGFTSPVQPDGSIMIKVQNFMDAHASAQSMAMAKGIRS